ncbi:MAG: CDP-alcohol phosphatidyltransferase family protein [Candidatus Micrarchaeia archaeon]
MKPITARINPNMITVASLLFAAVATYSIYSGELFIGIIFVGFAFAADALDGMVARAQGRATPLGAYLDGMIDRIVEMFILIAMMTLVWPYQWLGQLSILLLLCFGTFLTSFSKAYADHRKVLKQEEISKMGCVFERAPRVLLIFASLIIYVYNPLYSLYLLSAGGLLSIVAFFQRFWYVYEHS